MTANDFTVNRPLAGRAKNLLDDLLTLDTKIPEEIERGVRESYLEASRVVGLAERLKVRPPRIRSPRWVYVEWRQVQSVQIDSYDNEDAIRIFNEQYGDALRSGEVPYGLRRSHWANMPVGVSTRNTIVSEPTATRPRLDHDLRFHVERRGEPVALNQATTVTPVNADLPMPEHTEAAPVQPPRQSRRLRFELEEPNGDVF